MATYADRLLKLAGKQGILRTRDLSGKGIPRVTLTRLERAGLLTRISRGMYMLPEADITEHHGLALAIRQVPQGVICLLSALVFHELTTQNPPEVWLAIGRKARTPNPGYPPLRVVRFSAEALRQGVQIHRLEGVQVPVTSPARTIADCFAYRNKIGLDVALEALREYLRRSRLRQGKAAGYRIDALAEAAKTARVWSIMRPYLDALT